LVGLCVVCAPILGGGQEPLPDPFPLERFIVPAARVPQELARAAQGILVQMPRDEFEALVQQASVGQQKNKLLPSLVRSTYKAELKGNDLSGSGTWNVHHPGNGPAVLALPSLNIALKNVKDKSDGSDAILGELDGKGLALLLGKPGPQTIAFDWSAHGITSPSGLHFPLKLPACPLASLELALPADHVVSLPPAVGLVTGPHEFGDAQKRQWRLILTGKSQIDLDIRPLAGSSDLPPSLLARVVANQEIAPEKVKADFEFQVDVPHHPIRELVFDCEPGLAPYDVSLSSQEVLSWKLGPPTDRGKGAGPAAPLTIQLREPFQGTLKGLIIRCLAPRQADGAWTSPFMRLHQALTRGETLKIVVHPDVPLEKWDPGSFHLLSTSSAKDGSMVLTLVDPRTTDPRTATPWPRRPGFLGKMAASELHTAQQTWWHLGPHGATLTSEITFSVAQGSLYQLKVRLPTGGKEWRVDKVELDPPDLLQAWSTQGQELSVDLRGGLNPRVSAKLSVRLHSAWEGPLTFASKLLDFPDVEPIGATDRIGSLDIGVDPIFQASVFQHSTPPTSSNLDGPWGGPPNFSFPFRDKPPLPFRGQPVVNGKLRLVPSSSRLQAHSQTQVLIAPQSAVVQTRLDLDPVLGSLDHCDVMVTSAGKGVLKASLDKNSTHTLSLQRLPLREQLPHLLGLATPAPFALPGLRESVGDVQLWRLRFTPALTQRETVLLEMPAARPFASAWQVPLFSLLDTPRSQGEVVLLPSGVALGAIRTHGLVAPPAKNGPLQELRRFTLKSPMVPYLSVQTTPTEAVHSVQEHIDEARLSSFVLEDGRLFHHLALHAANWHGKELTVLLPDATAQVLGAKVAGLWLTNFPRKTVDKGLEIRVPAPHGAMGQHIDIFYSSASSWSGWHGWASCNVPWPILPVPPLTRQRTWHLPPGLTPARLDRWRQSDAPAGFTSHGGQLLRKAWNLGDPLLQTVLSGASDDQRPVQIFHDAEFALRKKWAKEFTHFTLAQALELLLFDHVKDQVLVAIDAPGLEAAGLGPATPVGNGVGQADLAFWETIGVALVPCRSGVVLTSRARQSMWQQLAPAALDRNVADALRSGRDPQGILLSAGTWLRHAPWSGTPQSSTNGDKVPQGLPPSLFSDRLPEFWTSWQMSADQSDEPAITVMRTSDVRLLSYLLVAATLLLVWRAWRVLPGMRFFRGLLLWNIVWGLAAIWVGSAFRTLALAPVIASLTIGLLAYVLAIVRESPGTPRRGLSTQTMVRGISSIVPLGLIILAALCLPPMYAGGGKEPANPNTVLILQGKPAPDGTDRAMVLVSPELVRRLKDLAQGPLDAPAQAMLIRGDYRGQVKGGLIVFQANFDVYCLTDKSHLIVPLTGVDLQEGSTLDGKAVFPSPNAGPLGGYALPIAGKGFHRLSLAFTSRWHPVADFHELRLGMPRLPQNHLHLTVPTSWQDVQAPQCQGEIRIVPARDHQDVFAELGQGSFYLRWRQDSAPALSAGLEVKEAYFWDLRPATFSLTASMTFTVTKGAVNHVELAIPDNAEIRSVELGANSAASARIKKWRLSGKEFARQLLVELANPITVAPGGAGKFQIVLSIVPRLALDAPFVQLRLPAPLGVKQSEGELAYRLEGWQVLEKTQKMQNLVIAAIPPEQFIKSWKEAGVRDMPPPTRAYTFRRPAGNALLQLNVQPASPTAQQEVTCKVYPMFTDVAVQLHVQGVEEEFSLLECDVPPALTVSHVSGSGIHHWSRTNTQVQIWLAQSARDAKITITGWLKNAPPLQADKPGRIELPRIRPPHLRLTSSVLKVQAGPGCVLEPEKLQGLTPEKDLSGFRYATSLQFYGGTFLIRPAAFRPVVRMLTSAGLQSGVLSFSTRIDCQLPSPSANHLELSLKDWPAEVRLEASQAEVKSQYLRQGNDHTWKITLPPGKLWPLALEVHGQMNLAPEQKIDLPRVNVDGADYRERWLVLAGADPQALEAKGLALVKNREQSLRFWAAELGRTPKEAIAWQIKDADWKLRIQSPLALAPLSWQLLWADHEIHNQEGHWLHQGNFFIATQSAAEVQVILPAGARFQAACWGDVFVNPRQDDARHLSLKLPQDPAGQVLRLRWTFAPEEESTAGPRLEAAVLKDAGKIEIQTIVWRAGGVSPLASPGADQGANAPRSPWLGEPLLSRAHGQMVLAGLLAEAAREQKSALPVEQVLAAQKIFFELVRHLDYELLTAARIHPDGDREIHAARNQVGTLRQQNADRCREGKYEHLRSIAEKTPFVPDPLRASTALPLPHRGQPIVLAPELVIQGLPAVARPISNFGRAVVGTQLLVIGFLALYLLSFLSRLFLLLPAFWPEQLLLAGLAGSFLLGVSLPGLAVMLLGVAGRLIWLGRFLTRLVNRFLFGRGLSSPSS